MWHRYLSTILEISSSILQKFLTLFLDLIWLTLYLSPPILFGFESVVSKRFKGQPLSLKRKKMYQNEMMKNSIFAKKTILKLPNFEAFSETTIIENCSFMYRTCPPRHYIPYFQVSFTNNLNTMRKLGLSIFENLTIIAFCIELFHYIVAA